VELKPNVELHIEELVLHGFAPGDRHAIARAVESEIARLIGERGLSFVAGEDISVARLDGGSFQVQPSAGPDAIGGQIAQGVYGGLG
jgi:hypothetical protein